MARYSVAEAKAQLTKLLVLAEQGEEVTITRRGEPVARIVAQPPPERGKMDMAFIDSLTIETENWQDLDWTRLIREMRDEGL